MQRDEENNSCAYFIASVPMIKNCIFLSFIFFSFVNYAPKLIAKTIAEKAGTLKILWNPRDTPTYTEDEDLLERELPQWKTRCEIFGERLLIGKGSWGTGVFESFSCWIGDQLVGGKPGEADWILRFKEGDRSMLYELSRLTSDIEVVFSSHELSKTKFAFTFLSDNEYVDMLALKLLDGLPALGVRTNNELSQSSRIAGRAISRPSEDKFRFGRIVPMKELVVFELFRTQDANLMRAVTRKRYRLTPKKINEKSLIWQDTSKSALKSKEDFVWFHSRKGPLALSKRLNAALEKAEEELSKAAKEGFISAYISGTRTTGATGHVMARLGLQLLRGDSVLKKSKFLGLLAETRGGNLSGFRILVDIVPKVSESNTHGIDKSFGWNRYSLGKAFDFNIDSLIDRVDLTPKIGLMNFNANVPIDQDDPDSELATYSFNRLLNLGLEAGAEVLAVKYSVRGWYGYDLGIASSSFSVPRIKSHRLGIDVIWKLGNLFNLSGTDVKAALLAFYFYEAMSLMQFSSDETKQYLTMSSGYAGLGCGLTW